MTFEWLVARRYIWSKRRHPFVGVISGISVIGIAVGVAALIVVMAVMNGFDHDLSGRIIGARAHLVVEKEGAFEEHARIAAELKKDPRVRGAAPYVEGQAIVQGGEWAAGVLVRGVDPALEKSVSKFFDYIVRGTLSTKENSVVIGSELAKRYGLRIGSEFLIVTQNTKKPSTYKVEGVFSSGLYEFDANLIFLPLSSAQTLFGLGASASGISVSLKDAGKADAVKKDIQKKYPYPFMTRTWMDMNRVLFGALKLEKIVMFMILALIILVACLNIAGSLTILVMDKTKDIGVLKALGAAPFSLMKIFAIDGLLVGAVGSAVGLAAGTGIAFLLKRYPLVELPKEIYFMDRLPVRVDLPDTLLVFGVAIFLSFLSALYPAITAGRLDPSQALKA